MRIQYSTDGGTNWPTIVSSTPDDGLYPWPVPGTPSGNCLVRVCDVSDPDCCDQGDGLFTLCDEPQADFIGTPTSGESYTCEVEFTDQSSGCVTSWSWDFGDGEGSEEQNPIDTFDCGTSYTVSLMVSGPCGSHEMIKSDYITCQCPCEVDLTSPDGGEIWCVGDDQNITWNSENTSGSMRIEYSTDSGSSWILIIDSTPDDGLRSWTVPDTVSAECLVRIFDTSSPECSDTSEGHFQICLCGSLAISTEELLAGTRGCMYTDSILVEAGCLPLMWTVSSGQLPDGLTLADSTGIIAGQPVVTGTFELTISVEDALGHVDDKAYSLEIGDYIDAKGDINADCEFNILDVLSAINIILELDSPDEQMIWRADCNGPIGQCEGDGYIDILDALKIVNLTLGMDSCP